jgi:hypothetical protein
VRAGQFIRQIEGYAAFIPAPLPPQPALELDSKMISLLSRADRALGRLDGVASIARTSSRIVLNTTTG